MRPPVAAGPMERKCSEANGECATAATTGKPNTTNDAMPAKRAMCTRSVSSSARGAQHGVCRVRVADVAVRRDEAVGEQVGHRTFRERLVEWRAGFRQRAVSRFRRLL